MAGGNRFYDEKEAEEILRLAARKAPGPGAMTREQLMSAASELGITPEAVAAAEAEYLSTKADLEDRREFQKHVRSEFWSHFFSYVVVCGGLFGIDVAKDGRPSWSLWVIGLWGIGLAFHIWGVLFPGKQETDVEFERWRRRKQRSERKALARKPEVKDALEEIALSLDMESDKLAAIKELRERTGLGLKESKEAVEEYVRKNS